MTTSSRAALCLAALLLFVAAGCGRQEHPAPSLVGERLDHAIDLLDRAGLDYETKGGGFFGAIVKSHWTVCRQEPALGVDTTSVDLFVERECPPIELPALAGVRLDAARRKLARLGLSGARVEVLGLRGAPVQPRRPGAWRVCRADPADSIYVGWTTVSLYVARTCPPAVVPDLVGRSLTTALRAVGDFTRSVDVTTIRGTRVDPRRPGRWIVCGQEPEAGLDWLELVVGEGRAASFSLVVNLQCTAPNVVGMTVARATAVLRAGGIEAVTLPFEGAAEPDRRRAVVCQQDPLPGESIDATTGGPLVVLYAAQRC